MSECSAASAEEIYGMLQETVYGDFINEDDRVHDFEQVLMAELKRVYETMYQLTPEKRSLISLLWNMTIKIWKF